MCFFCSQEFVSLLIWSSQVFKIKFQIAQFVTKKLNIKNYLKSKDYYSTMNYIERCSL